MSEIPDLPKGAPRRGRKIYAWVLTIAAILGGVAYAMKQIPPISQGVRDFCQTIHACAPEALKPMQPLASTYEKGNTVARAASAQFQQYELENPDWNICITDTKSLPKSDPLRMNFEYRMEGRFFGVPKWRGLLQIVGDYLAGRDYSEQACPKE